PPSTLVLADWSARLGQDLFYPPNVGGWPGGRSWLSTRALIGRTNYAAALVEGRGVGRPSVVDPIGLAARHGRGQGRGDVMTFYAELLFGGEPDRAWRDRIAASVGPGSSWGPETSRLDLALILACPEAQLC